MPLARLRLPRLVSAACLAFAAMAFAAFPVSGDPVPIDGTDPAETAPRLKQIQQARLMQKASARLAGAADRALMREQSRIWERVARMGGEVPSNVRFDALVESRGAGRKPAADVLEAGGRQGASGRDVDAALRSVAPTSASGWTPPPNVRVNNRLTDVAGASGQAEQDIGVRGQNILVAWNDGEGFAGNGDTQGWGYSTNGGASFIDGGTLPIPAGFPTFIWTSDPIIAVNEKTGDFWYAGLCSPTASTNGIAVVRGSFSGGSFAWQAPVIVRSESNFAFFLDKLWMVADSTNGNLYLTYTEFNSGGDRIVFRRSTNGGASWTSEIQMSSGADNGRVQGSRPVVGPNGEVYVFWYTIGTVDVDFMKMRASTNAGISFGVENIAATFYANWGTGAPGFNREMGIQFPSVTVDRTPGTYRGRIYLTWNESVNFYNDPLGTGTGRTEVESNNTPAQATSFSIGQRLRGNLANGDLDYFSFAANQGQTYIFWCDSLNASMLYTMRIFCSDGVQRLAFSGATFSAGDQGFIVWTAPTTATYYLRMAENGATGGYRILTGQNGIIAERSRDQRDVFVSYSSNGGTSWSSPSRVNDDQGLFDNWLPEIEVGYTGSGPFPLDGRPYVVWYDWRDALFACAGMSHVYLARSDNGGGSWSSLGPVTTQMTDWTSTFSNIAPNQGDYMALFADNVNLYPAWADGRNTDPDVYMAVVPLLSTPVLVSLASADATQERVRLEWFSGGDAVAEATVYRRTDAGNWTVRGTIVPDGTGRLIFEDRAIEAGARYGYRLGIREGDAERFFGEAWVDVPRTLALAITGIRPNPVMKDATLAFTLPTAGEVSIEILDVAGRTVRSLAPGALGAGAHQQRLLGDGRLPAGVYLVRLTHGGRTLSERMSVVQ